MLDILIAFVSRIDTAPSSIGTVYTKCAHLVYVYQWIWNWELFLRKVYVFPPATLALLHCVLNYARCWENAWNMVYSILLNLLDSTWPWWVPWAASLLVVHGLEVLIWLKRMHTSTKWHSTSTISLVLHNKWCDSTLQMADHMGTDIWPTIIIFTHF